MWFVQNDGADGDAVRKCAALKRFGAARARFDIGKP